MLLTLVLPGGGRGGGAPRGRGGRAGEAPARKAREEKPLPKSIDEMPKYEEKHAKVSVSMERNVCLYCSDIRCISMKVIRLKFS